MKPMLRVFGVLVVTCAVAFSGPPPTGDTNGLVFRSEDVNPVSHLRVNQNGQDFQFAIVSDRTGGHRANVFASAIEKLNLLQPSFVLSVGDLVEGKDNPKVLAGQWKEFDGFVNRLNMPFFYTPGNHDAGTAVRAKFWKSKLGRTYYDFRYRNVLFLILNSDDTPGKESIGAAQTAFVRKTLDDNRDVYWNIVLLHRPLWLTNEGKDNGWSGIEDALRGRSYTVFAGHHHNYQKYVRQGQNYYRLGSTGAGSALRGPDFGEIDHITWVTMKKDGPILANILLEAIVTEDLKRPITNER